MFLRFSGTENHETGQGDIHGNNTKKVVPEVGLEPTHT